MTQTVQVEKAQTSPFGGVRTVSPATLFGLTHEYSIHPLIWAEATTGTGSTALDAQNNSMTLTTGGAAADARALRQTKVYFRYQPGKSQVIKITGVLVSSGSIAGDAESRMGYYDDENGVYFGIDADGLFFCVRTNTTGSVVETRAYQNEVSGSDRWNEIARRGESIDSTKAQIVVIDLQWLGVGIVRCGFQFNDSITWVHKFHHANSVAQPYMRTANLPIRYEVINGAGGGSDVTMRKICCAVESDGGVQDPPGYSLRATTAGSTVSCADSATLTPVLTIRLKDTFNSLAYRGRAVPYDLRFLNTASAPAYFELIWNVATLTSAAGATDELAAGTWANVDATYSGVEQNTAATAYTGGLVIGSGYVSAAAAGQSSKPALSFGLSELLVMGKDYSGTSDTVTIAARGIGGAATLAVALLFSEYY